jgi:hypothetical protein
MYSWLIFLHVISVFGFLFAHGASAAVMFKVRAERDPARLGALLDLSNAVGGLMGAAGLLLLVTGIIGGFMRQWWGQGWIWVSLALLLGLSFPMSYWGRLYFDRVRRAIGVPTPDDRRKKVAPPAPAPPEQLGAVLASGRPGLLAAIGLGGLLVITWLMMFKPF